MIVAVLGRRRIVPGIAMSSVGLAWTRTDSDSDGRAGRYGTALVPYLGWHSEPDLTVPGPAAH